MNKVGIVGLGLIGGSLGLDLRGQGFQVFGVSRQVRTCQLAEERGAVDAASVSYEILSEAEVVFLCTPLEAIAPALERAVPYLSPEATVTDVGSVKAAILAQCCPLWPNFVGGHPMAGTADQGIEAAQPHLFRGTAYVLTPVEETPPAALEQVGAIAKSLGATVYQCSPEIHDRAAAWISHLPIAVSGALIRACQGEGEAAVWELARQIASSGFRDTSRVGGGNPELGVMVARYNRPALLQALARYRQSLEAIEGAIEGENWEKLGEILGETQQFRQQFPFAFK